MTERLHQPDDIAEKLRGEVDTDPVAYYKARRSQIAQGLATWILMTPCGETESEIHRYGYYVGGELAATLRQPADRPQEVTMTSEFGLGIQPILPPLPLERVVGMVETIFPPNSFADPAAP